MDSLNFTFMTNVVKASLATLAELAEVTNGTATTAQIQVSGGVEQGEHSFFSVYPNPAENQLTINLDENLGPCQITILSLSGETILQHDLQPGPTKMDVKDLPRGIYFVKVKSGKKESVVKVTLQ
jgi:hypothetical protein